MPELIAYLEMSQTTTTTILDRQVYYQCITGVLPVYYRCITGVLPVYLHTSWQL